MHLDVKEMDIKGLSMPILATCCVIGMTLMWSVPMRLGILQQGADLFIYDPSWGNEVCMN